MNEPLLSGEYDDHNALMEIHPGAGGTEAMDWGNMLLRMYQRYCDSRGLKFEVNNFEPGDEAGLKERQRPDFPARMPTGC